MARPLGSMVVSLGLDSTKFTNGLKSIQSQLRVAKSEMRATLTEIGNSGSAYDKASAEVEKLTKVMKINQAQIDELHKAYQQQVKLHGEYSASAMRVANRINDAVRVQGVYENKLQAAKNAMKEAQSGARQLSQELDNVQRTTRANATVFESNGNVIQANRVKYQGLEQEVRIYNQLIDVEKSKLTELIRTKGNDSEETQKQRTRIAELTAKQAQAQASLRGLGSEYKNMTSSQAIMRDQTRKVNLSFEENKAKIKESMSALAGFSSMLSLGLGVGLKTSIDQMSKFKGTLNDIKNLAVTGGESVTQAAKNVNEIQKQATELSNKYGVSVNKIANGYEDLIRRGYTTEQALGAMRSELQGSVASGDDFNEVVKVSSQVIESFGLKTKSTMGMIKNTREVTNVLAYAADATATSFADIGTGMEYVGTTAKNAGVSLSMTASLMGVLSNNGLEAEKAGTGLRAVINGLNAQVKTIDSDKNVLHKLGLTRKDLVDSKGNLRDIPKILETINSKMKGKGSAEKGNIFKALFGTTGQEAGQILAKTAKEVDELNKKVKNAPKNNYIGALSEKNLKSAQNQIKIFKESATNMGMSLAEVVLPPLSRLAGMFSKVFQAVASLPKPIRAVVTGIGLVAVALPPTILLISSLINAFTNIKTVLSTLNIASKIKNIFNIGSLIPMLMSPIGLAIAAIVALGTAFVVAYNKSKSFRQFINGIGQAIKNAFNNVKKIVGDIMGLFSNDKNKKQSSLIDLKKMLPPSAVAYIRTVVKSITNTFKTISTTVKPIFTQISKAWQSMVKGMQKFWNQHGKQITQAFRNVFKPLAAIAKVALIPVLANIQMLFKGIETAVTVSMNLVKNVFSASWNSIKETFSGVLTAIKGVFEIFAGVFTGNWGLVWQGIKDVFKGVWESFKGIVSGVLNSIIGLVNSGIDGVNWVLSKFGASSIGHISPVKWATGTGRYYPNGLPENQLAMVNDGGKREAIIYPNGTIGMFRDMNVTTILPKGTHVINGDDTERLGLTGGLRGIHHYADGTFSLSKVWDGIDDGINAAKRIISNPISSLVDAFLNSMGGSGIAEVVEIAKGMGRYIVKAIKDKVVEELRRWVKGKEDEKDSKKKKKRKGYALGGFVNTHQIAEIAEGNRMEAIIPLTNRTRAMQILSQIKDQYGLSAGDVVTNGTRQPTDLSRIENKFDKMLSLLGTLAGLNEQQIQALQNIGGKNSKAQFYRQFNQDQIIKDYMSY